MAATLAGALKAYVESLGLGLAAYRDVAPETAALPYVIITEGIDTVPDGISAERDFPGVRETVQVTLWQKWRDDTTRAVTESFTLPRSLEQSLAAFPLANTPTRVYGARIVSAARLLERDANLVQHPITLEIARNV